MTIEQLRVLRHAYFDIRDLAQSDENYDMGEAAKAAKETLAELERAFGKELATVPPHPSLMVCDTCNSEDVSIRADIHWDCPAQDWVVDELQDGYCEACESGCAVSQIPAPMQELQPIQVTAPKKVITVEVLGGTVQDVFGVPEDTMVIVKDYDNMDENNECSTEKFDGAYVPF